MGSTLEDGEGLIGSKEFERTNSKNSAWKKLLKSFLSHVGLLVTLMMYTILGGLLFYELEYPEEVNNLRRFEQLVREERQAFVEAVSVQVAAHNETNEHAQTQLDELLARYERAVQEAASSGVLVPLADQRPVHELTKWTQLQAIFFAVTVLTTIGYGNVAPATGIGRGCCMLFALVGIPLTVTVIADVGRLMASALPPLTAPAPRQPFVSAVAALALLLLFLAVGACFFAVLEPSWRFFDAFYFCFITMTTIGFGDLVPQTPKYMLVCTVYIVAGLGLTSTIIELVRQQYARSWRQLQALAEMLARLADDADRTPSKAGRDLIRAELRRAALALQDKAGWQQAVDRLVSDIKRTPPAPPPPVIQIVVYESSV
ncbi:TWiK family of potassium channels protein 7-like [Nilaparvata lugens]|uniref:TWiK family of potassium channels protein 7-like n=1 Tax=Nilaparvata lugens TaxID=108931 RepID=UPI00193E48EA|nr:TWiK family of potassium channels protein 7-like [Nilaparvata lugens]